MNYSAFPEPGFTEVEVFSPADGQGTPKSA